MRPKQPESRFFVAVWPDPAIVARLADGANPHLRNARPVSRNRLHLTLAFIGALDPAGLDSAQRALRQVEGHSCLLSIDRLGHWRRSGILWLGSSIEQPALVDLVSAIRARLLASGIATDSRPFRAHITVARKCWRASYTGALAPVFWPVSTFSLVESTLHHSGARYRPVETWPLGA